MGEQELQAFRLRNALHRQFGDQYDVDTIRKTATPFWSSASPNPSGNASPCRS